MSSEQSSSSAIADKKYASIQHSSLYFLVHIEKADYRINTHTYRISRKRSSEALQMKTQKANTLDRIDNELRSKKLLYWARRLSNHRISI